MRTARLALLLCLLAALWRPGWSGERKGDSTPDAEWAFQPLRRVSNPTAGIDGFITEQLRNKGLTAAPRADQLTLIRRATFDLTGLPPAPEEVDAFLADRSAQAWARLIDRLLASPRYGERWGRHWLDVARYADSDGYSNDYERPNAWRYRDYVIRSFNQDKPYDRFIREQVAGDELDPENPENLVAAGFLRMGPWEQTSMSVAALTRQAFLDDITHNTATAFLGLTLECARCHDHKFDPIPTRDYYRLQAVFAPILFEKRPAPFLGTENQEGFQRETARMEQQIRRTEARLEELNEKVRGALLEKHGVSRVADLPAEALREGLRKKENLTAADLERERAYRKRLELYRLALDRYRPLAYTVSSGGGKETKIPPETFVLLGGSLASPGDKVSPGVLSAVRWAGSAASPFPSSGAGRRLALAQWIASPSNPLTARVMVNRIWQHHFGKGLVDTPNNFGRMGKPPTHPELLDWLAGSFIDRAWSIKQMHRLMMMSAAYQRSSRHPRPNEVAALDPENVFLSHFSPRRMEAEELRDSILAVSGELSSDAGGPGVFPEMNADLARQPRLIMGTIAPAYQPSLSRRERNRRTIYAFRQRNLVDPLVEVFNGPSLNESCGRRESAVVASQALALFNSRFAHDMALAFALRLEKLTSDPGRQIEYAFRLAYNRLSTRRDRQLALDYLSGMRKAVSSTPPEAAGREPLVRSLIGEFTGQQFDLEEEADPAGYEANIRPSDAPAQTRALAGLTLVLLNSNEFLYIY